MATRTSSAQPGVWTVCDRDGCEVGELTAESKASGHECDQQGHLWEGPINEDTAAQDKAGSTWEIVQSRPRVSKQARLAAASCN
jgi:hypothetical protein